MSLKSTFTKLIPKRSRESDNEGPDSMVLLLKQEHFFSDQELRGAAEKAWNRTFEDNEDSRHFIVQRGRVTFVKVGPHVLNILHRAAPYLEIGDAELKEFLPENEREEAWRAHHAWCAVDYLAKETDEQTKYCVLAALVAEMVDGNCCGVWMPKVSGFIPNGVFLYSELKKIALSKKIDID